MSATQQKPTFLDVTIQGKSYRITPLPFGPLQRAWRHLMDMSKFNDDKAMDNMSRHMHRIRCGLGVYKEALTRQASIDVDKLAEEIPFLEAQELLAQCFTIFDISGIARGDVTPGEVQPPAMEAS